MNGFALLALVAAWLRISVPYVLGALGALWSEQSGIVALGVEGMLLTGAFAANAVALSTNSAVAGFVAGSCGGALLALLYALFVVGAAGDAVVCGVALNLLCDGATRFGCKALYGSSSNSPVAGAWRATSSLVSTLTHPLVLGSLALAFATRFLLRRTRFGLRVRAVGEHPRAARSLGISVARTQLGAVALCGALAGLGGAWLAADQHQFVAGMSSGRGYIALAAMIFGRWQPVPALAAALLFGAAEAIEVAIAAGPGHDIGNGWATLVQMLPYVLTIVALLVRPSPSVAGARSKK